MFILRIISPTDLALDKKSSEKVVLFLFQTSLLRCCYFLMTGKYKQNFHIHAHLPPSWNLAIFRNSQTYVKNVYRKFGKTEKTGPRPEIR